MRYVVDTLDADKDGWPEGLGNVEREGMGEEKLDNAVYLIRGLYDLADMARRAGRRPGDGRWATSLADRLRARFDGPGGTTPSIQYADSLGAGNQQVQQQHWIGVTPMEVELRRRPPAPRLAPSEHGLAALAERDTDCFSGRSPFNLGLFHTGCDGGPEGKGERIIFSLNTAIKAVADGNYGRREQRRYTDANAVGLLDEQPGALPEILPSPDQNRNIDRCWTCRSMFMQAWGHYGTAWPVIAPATRRAAGRSAPARLDGRAERPATARRGSRATRSGSATTARSRSAPSADGDALHDDASRCAAHGVRGLRDRRDRSRAARRSRDASRLDGQPRARRDASATTHRGLEVTRAACQHAAGRTCVTVDDG